MTRAHSTPSARWASTGCPSRRTTSASTSPPPTSSASRSFADALARELAEVAREHARAEGYHFVGPVTVTLVADDELRAGECDVAAEIHEGAPGRVARAARRPPGARSARDGRASGAWPTATSWSPTRAARGGTPRSGPPGNGFVVADLDSMNGTLVNGTPIREHPLADGDEIRLGNTVLRFEAS